MNRFVLGVVSVGLLGACGDGGTDSVGPGTWRLVGETVNGTATPEAQLNGAFELTAGEYGLGIARPSLMGVLASYTIKGGAFSLGGGGTVGFTVDGDRLTLRPDATRTWLLARTTPVAVENFAVTGTILVARGAPPMAAPRAALIRYVRELGAVSFFLDPRDNRALTIEGGTASFDFSRTRAALGTDRIAFGTTAGISIGLIVVYDDQDGSQTLGELAPCTTTTKDCIRGISTVILAFRDGASAELAASPYALLRAGWSNAVAVTDRRTGRLGLVSVDPDRPIQHEILVVVDPSTIVPPAFQL